MVQQPDAALTAVQFEIVQVVWDAPQGATVAEIWEAISKGRDVARTTVLNLVRRLDKRGWLKRANATAFIATWRRSIARRPPPTRPRSSSTSSSADPRPNSS